VTPVPAEDNEAAAILIVDDHLPNLLAAQAVLDPLGYRIVTASSGAEALKQSLTHDFVMIVMDVHMAGLDGFQTTALLRQREQLRDVPVIFLTALNTTPEHTRRGYDLGAVDFITKPYDPEVVRAKVRALVGLYTRGQRTERMRSREMDRIKDLFLGAVGHDLRNPLSAILMASKLISSVECSHPSHRNNAERCVRAARRMTGMIEDILDLTRGQFSDGIPLTREAADFGEVTSAVIAEFRVAHPNRVLELDCAGATGGVWDGGRLARVVSNLVGNALQHSADGPVRVSLRGTDDEVTLTVHNGGEPISEETLPTLFEPFKRGDTSVRGLGLGLYIVGEIVRAHGGTVGVTSSVAEGTTFRVSLPRKPADEPSGAEDASAAAAETDVRA
jgi:two-component system sensor histidine kinase/response regulator